MPVTLINLCECLTFEVSKLNFQPDFCVVDVYLRSTTEEEIARKRRQDRRFTFVGSDITDIFKVDSEILLKHRINDLLLV